MRKRSNQWQAWCPTWLVPETMSGTITSPIIGHNDQKCHHYKHYHYCYHHQPTEIYNFSNYRSQSPLFSSLLSSLFSIIFIITVFVFIMIRFFFQSKVWKINAGKGGGHVFQLWPGTGEDSSFFGVVKILFRCTLFLFLPSSITTSILASARSTLHQYDQSCIINYPLPSWRIIISLIIILTSSESQTGCASIPVVGSRPVQGKVGFQDFQDWNQKAS